MEEKEVFAAVRGYLEAYAVCCKPLCCELGLPQMAFDILMFLADSPECCTARDISQEQGFKENVLSVNVSKLVSEGYLERRPVEGDRRKVRLVCTERAMPVVRRGREIRRQFLADIRRGLSEDELDAAYRCLAVIRENAKRIERGRQA